MYFNVNVSSIFQHPDKTLDIICNASQLLSLNDFLTALGSLSRWCSWWEINKTCATCVRWARRKVRGWRPMAAVSSSSSPLQSATKRWCSCSQSWCATPAWTEKLKSAGADPAAPSPWLNSSTMFLGRGGNRCEQVPDEKETCVDTCSAMILRVSFSILLECTEAQRSKWLFLLLLLHAIIFKMSHQMIAVACFGVTIFDGHAP